LLALTDLKNYIQKKTGAGFKYYRPLYSVFALVTLVALLWFQFSLKSGWLFSPVIFSWLPGAIAAFTGLCIMIICINKYFYEMSGLQAIQKRQPKQTLQQTGLHQYIRHPLYLGTLLFIWGLFFIFPLTNNLIAASVITIYVLLGITLEEKKLHKEYGEAYRQYAIKVPRLIPNIFVENKKGRR
jgi:protein-S-isoprenylcysteine O-methyltransferase Ste14